MRTLIFKIVMASLLMLCATASSIAAPTDHEIAARDARIAEGKNRLTDAIKNREELENELSAMRSQVREQTGLVEVTPEAIRQMIAHLQEQREQLELDAAGAEGRRRALVDAVAKLSSQLKERSQSDAVVDQLRAVVVLREKQLARVRPKMEAGQVSQADVEVAEASVATAKAEMAAAQQRASGGGGADALDTWNRQILEVGVAAQEREARLQHIAKRLATFSSALGNLDKLERLRSEVERHDRAVERYERNLGRETQTWDSEDGSLKKREEKEAK